MKSLQKEQNSTNLLLSPPIFQNKPAITPKWFNSLDTNSIVLFWRFFFWLFNSKTRQIQYFRPLFSALVALLCYALPACSGALAQLSHSTQFVLSLVSCRNWEKSDHAIYFENNLVKSKCSKIFFAALTSFLSMPRNQMSALWIIVQWSSAEEKSTIERIHGKLPVFKSLVEFFLVQVF